MYFNRLYLEAAVRGNSFTYLNVGRFFYNGYYVKKNYRRAFKSFKRAAKYNVADAKYYLGRMYYYGFGTPVDYKKAFELFSKSARENYSQSINYLGCMYEDGLYVKQSHKNAQKCYLKAAKGKLSVAEYKYWPDVLLWKRMR